MAGFGIKKMFTPRVFFCIIVAGSSISAAGDSGKDRENAAGFHRNEQEPGRRVVSRVHAGIEYELSGLRDPGTGRIPPGMRSRELAFAGNLPAREKSRGRSVFKTNALYSREWSSCGPYNVGGRTRAVGIDLDYNDGSNRRILAGGVSGGMYISENGGASWKLTSSITDLPSVTCIAQDPASHNIWYYGTGEGLGNSASAAGAYYYGQGVFKSTDGGDSWTQLPATVGNRLNAFDSGFDIIWNIAVHPATHAVFASTFGGIQRSLDGGETWDQVLGGGTLPVNEFTDVAIASDGVVYATLSRNGTNASKYGIFRSPDGGGTWTPISPGGLSADPYLMAIAPAPSDPDILYLLVQANQAGDKPQAHQFFRYNAKTGSWINLSAKLPNFQDNFHAGIGYFNSQAGYDLLVKVKPDNQDIVWIGGTNLYRSLDGGSAWEWVGGYHPRQYFYPNQHPDQHALAFFPNRPNSLIAGHDGGLSLAGNDLESPQTWTSLNNGFLTTQFFAVSIDPLARADLEIIGGMQDNGSWGAAGIDANQSWSKLLSGDGGYAAVAPGGNPYYVSQQEGNVVRVSTVNGRTVQSVVTPAEAKDFLFVTPYQLDPNDPEVMYLAAGGKVWRNSRLADIPSGNSDSTKINWSALSNSAEAGTIVTSLAAAGKPANRLYFGATDKKNRTVIKRLDSAQLNPAGDDITPAGVIPGSTPSCICLNPDNPSEMLISFSNYNVPSLWHSDDGGDHWTDVEGNLGGADGPSVRWAVTAPTPSGTVYFIGTSIGLFTTGALSGPGTVWVQEGRDVIGNVVVGMIAARVNDGFLVAGTHGRGVFTANLSSAGQSVNDRNPGLPRLMELENGYPNPFNSAMAIAYRIGERSNIELSIVDANGRTVRILESGEKMPGSYSVRWNGEDTDGIQAASGIYLVKMEIEDHPYESALKKIVLLR